MCWYLQDDLRQAGKVKQELDSLTDRGIVVFWETVTDELHGHGCEEETSRLTPKKESDNGDCSETMHWEKILTRDYKFNLTGTQQLPYWDL